MKYNIHLGSENPVKLNATAECLHDVEGISFNLIGKDVDSGVNPQPQSLNETVEGAVTSPLVLKMVYFPYLAKKEFS